MEETTDLGGTDGERELEGGGQSQMGGQGRGKARDVGRPSTPAGPRAACACVCAAAARGRQRGARLWAVGKAGAGLQGRDSRAQSMAVAWDLERRGLPAGFSGPHQDPLPATKLPQEGEGGSQ